MTSKVYLLDADVLIALADDKSTSHQRAVDWFQPETRFATCPITQGALLRHYMRQKVMPTIHQAKSLLAGFTALPNHHFWPDDASYENMPTKGVMGYRQVTDAYLVLLAAEHKGVLATMNEALAAVHPDVLLLPRYS
jgi:toxin-antitoxin system PIN domain toxin